MSETNFTDDQLKARDDSGHNIIVSAGAGSGKTFVLAHRVLHFITEKNYKIKDFLIVTFTVEAAGEMKERIRNFLTDANSPEANLVDEADIGTFDALMLQIVKRYHNLINVSNSISIIDNSIIKTKVIEYINEEFERLYGVEGKTPFKDGVRRMSVEKKDDNVVDLTYKIYSYFGDKSDYEIAIDEYFNKVYNPTFIKDNIIKYYVDIFLNFRENLKVGIESSQYWSSAKGIDFYNELYSDWENFLLCEENYDSLMNNFPLKFSFTTQQCDNEDDKKARNQLKDDINLFKNDYFSEFKMFKDEQSIIDRILEDKEFIHELLNVVKNVRKRIDDYKKELNCYEFVDISNMAINLIKNNDDVRNELKNKYKMIMVDEYQDTSTSQEEFVNLIGNNNVYMVGDVKQSIYGFRGARPELFQNKYNLYKNDSTKGEAIDLRYNFRSRGEVLTDINNMFKTLMVESLGGINYTRDHIIGIGNTDYAKVGSNGQDCHFQILPYDCKDRNGNSEIEANIIVNDIIDKMNSKYQVMEKDKLRDCKLSDFCILISTTTDFETFIKVFEERGVPLNTLCDIKISEHLQPVYIIQNIIRMIDYIKSNKEKDSLFNHSYTSIARSYIFEYSDDRIYQVITNHDFDNDELYCTFKSIIDNNLDEKLSTILQKILYEIGLYDKLSKLGDIKSFEYLYDNLISNVVIMEKMNYSITNIIDYFEDLKNEDNKAKITGIKKNIDSVNLMTIHKSKGLEFNIIYYPCLSKTNFFGRSKGDTKIDLYGVSFKSSSENPLSPVLKFENNINTISEKIRLWYVALTRAKEKMIFIYKVSNGVKKLEKAGAMVHLLKYSLQDNCFPSIGILDVPKNSTLNLKEDNSSNNEKFIIKDLPINKEEIEIKKASKEIKSNVNYDALTFGTQLHFIMEVFDFKKKDFSMFDEKNKKYKDIVEKFINSPLLKDIDKKNCELFREFSFNDEKNNTHGIIDLFIKYDDHIDIIDYKTKEISDSLYDTQLHVYRDYLQTISNLPINMYLYSLTTGEYRKVE